MSDHVMPIAEVAALCEGVDQVGVTWSRVMVPIVSVLHCQDFRTLCERTKAKEIKHRLTSRADADYEIWEALGAHDELIIEHLCWPHLHCDQTDEQPTLDIETKGTK